MFGLDVRRAGLLLLVGSAHAAVAFALAHVHAGHRVPAPVVAIETRFFEQEERFEQPPAVIPDVEPMRMRIDAAVPMLNIEFVALTDALPSSRAPAAITTPLPVAPAAGPAIAENVQYLQPPRPRYPALSRRLKEEGVVVLKVLVNERGAAQKIEVADSSGHERLDQAAVEAVAAATFRPFLENGTARAMLVLIPIEFGLHRART